MSSRADRSGVKSYNFRKEPTMDAKQMFPLSSELKAAMGVWATEHNMSVAQLIRESVAEKIGFDLEPVDNRRKFANAEERKAYYAEKAKEDRALLKALRENEEVMKLLKK